MTKPLQDKIAIVTGASNGIGRAIAETFAAEGAKTVLVARRAELLDEVAAGIEAKGGTALGVPTDLTKEDEDRRAVRPRGEGIYGRLDVLVNNAGISTHKNTEDITLQYWNEALAINITAAFLCSREAIRVMKAQTPQGGRIINIGSVSAKTPRPDLLPYTVTKHGLQGMTHQLTMDGRKHNIVASMVGGGSRVLARIGSDQGDDLLCFGNTHEAFHRVVGKSHFVAAGSVGSGSPDDPSARYAVIDMAGAELMVNFRSIAYDHLGVEAEMRAAGLSPSLLWAAPSPHVIADADAEHLVEAQA